MNLRGPGGMPQDLYLASGGNSAPGGQWPRGWREFARSLERPWLALAALGLGFGLALRYPLTGAEPAASLSRMLDWLHLLLWFSAAWLVPAFERLLWRQTRSGLSGGSAALGGLLFGNATLMLGATALLALAPAAVLLAFNPRAELMSFHDAEHHYYSVSLGGAYFGVLLLGGSALIALSSALLLLLRRLFRGGGALAAWLLLSAVFNFGLLSGNGWLATLGLRKGSAWTQWLQPGLGGLLHQRLRDFLLAEERYQYSRELIGVVLRDAAVLLGIGILALVIAQIASLARRRTDSAPVAQGSRNALEFALFSSALLSFAGSFGQAVWFASNPAASGPAAPAQIAGSGLLAALAAAWLLGYAYPPSLLLRRRPAAWAALLGLPLLWLGLCSSAITAGLAERQAAVLACGCGAALLGFGICLLLLASALQSSGRGLAQRLGDLALLLCGALLVLPLAGWQPAFPALLSYCLETLQSPQTAAVGAALLALLTALSAFTIWLIQRPAVQCTKAAAPPADKASSAR